MATKPFRPEEGSKEQTALNEESGRRSQEQNDVNGGLWAQAEHAAFNQTGGFAGVGAEGKRIQTQAKYDQMVASDKQVKAWGGEPGPGTILGDTR